MRQKRTKNHRKVFWNRMVIFLLLALTAVCLLAVRVTLKNMQKEAASASADSASVPSPDASMEKAGQPEEETIPQKIDFQALWAVNTDAYAYIEIPGTEISYPILQSTTQEEDYYLNVTFDKKSGLPGSIYTQRINTKDFSDPITLIYGHDMADGSYFGELKNYTDRTYFDSHRDIFIYLPDRRLQYQVIAEVVFGETYIPAMYEFQSANAVMTFMQDLQNIREPENQFAENLSVDSQDTLIVLCTCIGNRPQNRRLIVAKLADKKRTASSS